MFINKLLNVAHASGRATAAALKVAGAKHGPTALIFVGVSSLLVSTVTACIQARKLDDLIEEDLEHLEDEKIQLKVKKAEVINRGVCTPEIAEKAYAHDLRVTYIQTGIKIGGKLIRHFAIPVAFWGLGVLCIYQGTSMLMERLAAATSAYMAIKGPGEQAEIPTEEELGEVQPGDIHGFDFIWGSGMEGFDDNNKLANLQVIQSNQTAMNNMINYGFYQPVNVLYGMFGQKVVIPFKDYVFPYDPTEPYPVVLTAQELPNTIDIDRGKTAPDYYIHLERLPIPIWEVDSKHFTKQKKVLLEGSAE